MLCYPGSVVVAALPEVRGQERVELESVSFKLVGDEEDIAQRIGYILQGEAIPRALMDHAWEGNGWRWGVEPVSSDPFDFRPATASCHDKSQIPDLRLASTWPVDLVYNTVSEGGPESAGA
jgi:hypothetical protein